jgi:hypothetical protein
MTISLDSNVTATNDTAPRPAVFVVANEYQRFAEFCDACRLYQYIGLCYGAPGVGKTLSARHYADWDRIAAHLPVRDAETAALQALRESQTVFYTPAVVHSPGQIDRDMHGGATISVPSGSKNSNANNGSISRPSGSRNSTPSKNDSSKS